MGDHFVLLVDRLLTESTLEATIQSANQAKQLQNDVDLSVQTIPDIVSLKRKCGGGKLEECRICQDEDEECNMEVPCSCCGSLKYAHRKCVQRWCNEKGDTVCEICLEQFKPGYTAPPRLFYYGGIPMNFRGNWEFSRRDNPQLTPIIATDHDHYTVSTVRRVFYCRAIAFIFIVLLILRHALPIILTGHDEYSLTLFALLTFRIAGILVPVYVLVRSLFAFNRRRHLQEIHELPIATTIADIEQSDSSPR